jgi:uncharacterized membrane protein
MKQVLRYFLQGCLVTVPIAVTGYALYFVFTRIGAATPTGVPALGVLLIVAAITGVGYLSSSFVGKMVVDGMERWVQRVPLVGLVYNSVRDLLAAFVGDRRAFERPVRVTMGDGSIGAFGFLTCEHIPFLDGHVAVYLPQAYNFAGNLVVCQRERVSPLDVDRATLMTFVVSGGVSGPHRDAPASAP